MKIKKIMDSIGVLGKIINSKVNSDKDAYSCNYINDIDTKVSAIDTRVTKLETYTEEEQLIGTWIDGKPLYRKVVPVNFSTSSTSAETPHGISNIGYICKQKLSWFDTSDKVWYEHNKGVGLSEYFITIEFVTSTNIVIKQNAYNWQGRTSDRYCILEYTKTTD